MDRDRRERKLPGFKINNNNGERRMMTEVMKEKKIWTLRSDEFYGRWKNGGLVERIRWLNVRMDNAAGNFGIHVMD